MDQQSILHLSSPYSVQREKDVPENELISNGQKQSKQRCSNRNNQNKGVIAYSSAMFKEKSKANKSKGKPVKNSNRDNKVEYNERLHIGDSQLPLKALFSDNGECDDAIRPLRFSRCDG